MKRVLVIIGKLNIGGAERVGRDIGFYADPQRFQIHYLVFGQECGEYEEELTHKGCVIHHIPSPTENQISYFLRLVSIVRKYRFDVIHSHTMFNSGWAMLAGALLGVRVRITHSHTIEPPKNRSAFRRLYEKSMRGVINRFSTAHVGCGVNAGRWLYGEKFFDRKGILIYNGIDLSSFSFDADRRTQIRKDLELESSLVIGHVGHLSVEKNQAFLIRLLRKLREDGLNATLLLLGNGADREMLMALGEELGVSQSIRMTGNVPNVGDYLSAMDVFAFPSLYEGMPLALVEAQINGLPCVISDRIPGDAQLTGLVCALPLEHSSQWENAIRTATRRPLTEEEKDKLAQVDVQTTIRQIYGIYEGNAI